MTAPKLTEAQRKTLTWISDSPACLFGVKLRVAIGLARRGLLVLANRDASITDAGRAALRGES